MKESIRMKGTVKEEKHIFDKVLKSLQRKPSAEELCLLENAIHALEQAIANGFEGLSEKNLKNVQDVATICVEEVGLGFTSALSVAVYELVKFKVINFEDVEREYGSNVYSIIDGLLKISDFKPTASSKQADNFRNLLLNLATDVRVILIKIAERLKIMRVLKHEPADYQLRIAHEAFYLYAPLAHRLGLYKVKSEMEDLGLKYTDPESYFDIAKRLNQTAAARNKFIKEFIDPLEKRLSEENLKFEIKGRPKSIHSIWNKMRKNKISFDDIYDKFAIRIILDSPQEKEKSDCWKAYSVVTENYQPNPLRLRDWISVPKTNGYESLHTTVVVPGGQWVEVQIRTIRMDEIAEKGFAAHWKYKENKGGTGIDDWLSKVREMIENPEPNAIDFVDDFKLSLYTKEIFVFTPRGDLKKFPQGATVLDFAFDVHSQLGQQCVGARVNGKNVPIKHVLKNGEKVEILTSKNQKPKLDWLNFVETSKAKTKIKQSLNEAKMKDAELGKDLVKRRFKNWKINYSDTNINQLLRHYKLKNSVDFYYLIANEKIDIAEVKDLLTHEKVEEKPELPSFTPTESDFSPGITETAGSSDFLIIDEKLVNVDYKLAKCCNPIFGDPIFGFVTIGEGIKIHRMNCPNATQMMSRYNYRVVNARWKSPDKDYSYVAGIHLTGIDEFGIFNKISELLTKDLKAILRSINLDNHDGLFEGRLKVMVKDKNHLDGILHRLNNLEGVLKAVRED